MEIIFVVLKLLVLVAFLVAFIRRPTIVWGIGLLTVTTAVLLDTLLGTFNREDLLADLGFFFYVLAGALFAGAAAWFWGVVRPLLPGGAPAVQAAARPAPVPAGAPAAPFVSAPPLEAAPHSSAPLPPPHTDGYAVAGFDRAMLYEEVRQRFSRDDLQDLMFDLGVNELDVVTPGQSNDELIVRIMDAADRDGHAGDVALAVERILTPPLPEHLPRLEKLSVESPRTVLRHYLLAHYSAEELQAMTAALGIDWEQLEAGNKKDKVRSLLLYLYRRSRIDGLLAEMRLRADEARQRADAGE